MSGPVRDGYHWLYRVFDAEGLLLYIGRTHNPWQRTPHQLCTAHWSDYADHIDWEPIGPYHLATQAEVAAINAERPIFNLQHNPRGHATRRAYLELHPRQPRIVRVAS